MIRMQNVYGKAILVCLIQILVGVINGCILFIYRLGPPPFKGLAPIKSFFISGLILSNVSEKVFNIANSSDPDETLPFMAFYLGLHYL